MKLVKPEKGTTMETIGILLLLSIRSFRCPGDASTSGRGRSDLLQHCTQRIPGEEPKPELPGLFGKCWSEAHAVCLLPVGANAAFQASGKS